jgi:hypothetical protein
MITVLSGPPTWSDSRSRPQLRGCLCRACLTVAIALFGLMAVAQRAAAVSTGGISGTVTEGISGPPVYTDVHLIDEDGPDSAFTCTGADGTYTFSNLSPGNDYRVLFASSSGVRMGDPCPGGIGYHPQFYNDKQSVETADPVVVTAGVMTTGIDAALLRCTTVISGTVTDASSHASIQGATVSAYSLPGEPFETATTDAGSGAYELTVTGGTFLRVGFAAPGYVSQFYADEPYVSSGDVIETAFTCGFGAQPVTYGGIDAALAPLMPTPSTNPQPTTTPPTLALSEVRQSHRRWRRSGGLPRITSVGDAPIGTTFRFRLNESARVRLAFTEPLPGRRVRGRCVAPTSMNRRSRACTRTVTRGALSFSGRSGLNKIVFQGRFSRHKALNPGRYTLIITAADAAGQRATARLKFTIVS